jgi:hypothetical protein
MKTILRTITLFLFATFPAWAADGIAFISDIRGEVAIDGSPRPMLLSELAKGQKVTVGRDSQASVMYIATGKEYVLKGPGDYLVKDTEIAGSIMPPVSRSTEWRANSRVLAQVAQASAASVRMRSIAAPKADAGARSAFPADGNVATLQPVFRWRTDEAKPAEFTLVVVGQDKPVHVARSVNGTTYKVPTLLRPETEYFWTAVAAGSEVGAGKFRTLSNDALNRIEKRRPSERAEFSDRLMFALLLQELGATQEAREAWTRLAQERADLPELSALLR